MKFIAPSLLEFGVWVLALNLEAWQKVLEFIFPSPFSFSSIFDYIKLISFVYF